ncbi:hypothetical protein LTR84_003553 [Exophiala bonariae]|uniref:Major facilitator superfamily (MFS) profile domain-containing protein n=1 Tax=Exophiala bonariae TaxID=1690606 RepID=A0AAV9NBC5_9EURO|nr:hypothetical protein LTR84_003553 [Exophiala bonariae]
MATDMEKTAKDIAFEATITSEDHEVGTTAIIYIDPAREAAVRRKFDIYVVPMSVIYLVLSTLDRNNTIACRMLLNAAEAGLAQAFAFLFSTIYPRELAGKRIMTTNLAQCISGAFGGLFAYAVQTMGSRHGFAAWRWLFIIEFGVTVVICGIGLFFLPGEVEKAWFLNEEEKEIMRLKKERDYLIRGEEKFERKWIKIALTDPFVYLLGIAFFTSSVAINGFGVFLPTIIYGLG